MKVQSRFDNKKIGELVCDGAMKFVQNFAVEINGERVAEYLSLDAVAKDWKDYKEPLIKDEKVRKVFREWAELFGAEQFLVNPLFDSRRKTTAIRSVDITTEPSIELPGHIGEDSEIYTKEELGGEEETMIVLIITNIILVVVIGAFGVALLIEMAKDSRPIIIKEAKALREYYEGKLKELQEKTDKAEKDRSEYKAMYEHELQRNSDMSSIRSEKNRLEAQVERLNKELDSCDGRINEMAQENASLKEKIKALEKPAKKGK